MKNNYYEKNNYEEFYTDFTNRKKTHTHDCYEDEITDENYDTSDVCNNTANTERRPIRRCDEETIEKEINNLFKFILNALCNTEEDIDVISKAFVKLAKLLIEDTCLELNEEQLVCCVAQDLQALQVLIDKTIKDVKCLKKNI